ncbi:MAG: DUF1415 domain-containing protein [Burkholderiales bacterium]|nr:DUF1415 domain-containing protein [Burkholderiales bacterium]
MTDVLTPFDDEAETTAAVDATRHWLEAAVIGLNLCPFAKAVHVKQQIRWAVTAASDADTLLAELRRELALLADADPQAIDTTLLIHPRALTDFIDYRFFLDDANRALRKLGYEGMLQLASFHPRYEFADAAPDDVANHTNRSPHPMLHLLREASIDRAVATTPDAAQIYGRNIVALRRLGLEGWRRLFDAHGG